MYQTAIISGASRGIGAAIATEFAQKGYHLSLCCKSTERDLLELADNLRVQYHIQVLTFIGDVSSERFVSAMVRDTLQAFHQIDVLVNNAGISYIGLLSDMSIEDWNRVIGTNLTSVFSFCKAVIPSMVSRKSGKIINISSVWGSVGASCETAYSASKGGVQALTKALAKELAPSSIQVNSISCGAIDTAMNADFTAEEKETLISEIPSGRLGLSTEVAELASSLASLGSYLTGQIITLDGGWH